MTGTKQKRKAGGLDTLRNLTSKSNELITDPVESLKSEIIENQKIEVKKQKPKNFPYLLHPSVHDVIREIAHVERRSMTSVINEGLDMFLKSRAQPSIKDIKKNQ